MTSRFFCLVATFASVWSKIPHNDKFFSLGLRHHDPQTCSSEVIQAVLVWIHKRVSTIRKKRICWCNLGTSLDPLLQLLAVVQDLKLACGDHSWNQNDPCRMHRTQLVLVPIDSGCFHFLRISDVNWRILAEVRNQWSSQCLCVSLMKRLHLVIFSV